MPALKNMGTDVFGVEYNSCIKDVIAEGLELSIERHDTVTFKFNGVFITVCKGSDPEVIHGYYKEVVQKRLQMWKE